MNNKNALISTAMLAAIWERQNKDIIDLISPFVLFIISEKYALDNEIDLNYIQREMEVRFSFDSFPIAIIKKILKRNKKYIKLDFHKYYYQKALDALNKDFNKKFSDSQKNINDIISSLDEYLEKYDNKYQPGCAQGYLSIFLKRYGYETLRNDPSLKYITESDDAICCKVAQFVLSFQGDKTKLNQIRDIAIGFFLSRAIYMQENNSINSKFKDTGFYFDTTLMLFVLGLKTEEDNKIGRYLTDTILDLGGKIFCFEHVFSEIDTIISSYNYRKFKTSEGVKRYIEYFEINDYTYNQIERYRALLRSKISNLNIEICDTPEYDAEAAKDSQKKQMFIGEEELKKSLMERIPSYKSSGSDSVMLDNDIKSVSAIPRLREGKISKDLEACKAIFVTTNEGLVSTVNDYLRIGIQDVSPIITDTDLSAILWLKTYKTNPDYPITSLITFANSCFDPLPSLINKVYDEVDCLEKEGTFTQEMAIACKKNYMILRETMLKTNGDENEISNDLVEEICNQHLRKKYQDESNEKYKAACRELKNEKDNKEKIRIDIIKNIEDRVNKKISRRRLGYLIGICILFTSVFIISLITLIYPFIGKKEISTVFSIISVIISGIGIIDMLVPRFQKIKKSISHHLEKKQKILNNKYLEEEKRKIPSAFE